MEFVGRTVKKEFLGFGIFSGTIRSFDSSSGLFEIMYEDGNSEEMDLSGISMLLDEVVGGEGFLSQLNHKPRVGRKPKKRRKVEPKCDIRGLESGNLTQNLVNDDHFHMGRRALSETVVMECGFVENSNSNESMSVNANSEQTVCVNEINLNRRVNLNDVVDPHEGINLNDELCSKDGLDLSVKIEEDVKRSECFDLNLDVKGECDASIQVENSSCCFGMESLEGECHFDLNIGFDDENKNKCGGYDERSKENRPECGIGAIPNVLKKLQVEGDGADRNPKGLCSKVVEEIVAKGVRNYSGHELGDSCIGSIDGTRKEDIVLGEGLHEKASFGLLDANCAEESDKCSEVQVKGYFLELGPMHQDVMAHSCKEGNTSRKRRKIAENLKSTAEVVLRRSTRKGSTLMSTRNHASSGISSYSENDCSPYPSVSEVPVENPISVGCEGLLEPSGLLAKVELPRSSQNLNLDGISVVDVFFVYACLRSFSTLLFLSPFELEDFVAALKCKYPTSLFDFIHVSLLQILRKHLEFLSNEGSQSAIDCLRSLNWSLLDLITWPIFMANYLMFHNNGLKYGLDLNLLKLFDGDYYKQPTSIKVEVLRCLCDDVIEVEAIRSELNRRLWASEPGLDFDRNVNSVNFKKRVGMDVYGGTCLMEEEADETTDRNSDECCLCKMDGSLICCDGCPAAYHSKCVGVVNDLLPEGDWYCPECVIDKHKQIKPRKSLRGAELLGVDPHGRLYFSCCCYLLVSDSCNAESSFNYYQSCDVNVVIEVLKSSDSDILSAISKHWNIPVKFIGDTNSKLQKISCSETSAVKDETVGERTPDKISSSGHLGFDSLKSVNLSDSVTVPYVINMEKPNTSSEGSVGITLEGTCVPTDCSNGSRKNPNLPEVPRKNLCVGEDSVTATSLDIKLDNNSEVVGPGHTSSTRNPKKKNALLQVQSATGYMNCYIFALTASSVAEELICKSSGKIIKDSTGSVEDIISAQLKIILKKCTKFCWPSHQNINMDAHKEICGWCFSCKTPTDDSECLFKMIKRAPILEGSKSEVAGIQLNWAKLGHLIDVHCHIMSIEDRLHGLLLGPWLNPHYTNIWRQTVLKVPDVKSLKHLLLTLESYLPRRALLDDWLNHVDSANVIGSASHVVSKLGITRKRARNSECESNPSSNPATGLGLYWWRGGKLSRRLFTWKVLPQSLASRAARQAGCMKIPGILYPDHSDFAKRSKYIAWQAAVETSISVEQLAFQVRDFDLNIKWDDVENAHLLPMLDKDSKKSVRSFKKAIIRRKSIEGSVVKYLLDFGKRRFIPDVVSRYGCRLEEKSSERKKYWLEESHVPLHLLKSFEERRIARKSTNVISVKLRETARTKKPLRKSGFSYLFSKAQRSENYQCELCNKNVPIREAVCCQYCNGFFHKRHVRKSPGAVTAKCTYTCHKCWDAKLVKIDSRRRRVQSQKCKIASIDSWSVRLRKTKRACRNECLVRSENNKEISACVPLRRSARKVKYVPLENKKAGGSKKGKQFNSKKRTHRKPKKGGSLQRKRSQLYHTYWLNGLLLSERPNDERVMNFKKKQLVVSSKPEADIVDQMQCRLCCEVGDTSTLNLISCDFCGDWFHGDAFGLNVENIDKLIRFKCHVCRKRDPPLCPHLLGKNSAEAQSVEVKNNGGIEYVEEAPNALSPPTEVFVNHKPCPDEQSQGSHLVGVSVAVEQQLCMAPDSIRPYKSPVLEENTVELDHECVPAVEAETPACEAELDVVDTELLSLGHNEANNGLMKTTSLNSLVDDTQMNYSDLHPQINLTSCDLVDEGQKGV